MAEEVTARNRPPGELLPWSEIQRRYPNEWVVLVDTDWTDMKVTVGVVHAHSPSKKTAYDLSKGLREVAIFWTGATRSPTLAALMPDVDQPV
jgi:hypothetical protein